MTFMGSCSIVIIIIIKQLESMFSDHIGIKRNISQAGFLIYIHIMNIVIHFFPFHFVRNYH